MSQTKLSELLPIPEGVQDPHAYQVFGLEGGERDAAKIKAAVQQTYAHLKACKSNSDPKVWKKAAKLAEKARATLHDPDKRAELDARFGVIAAPTPSGVAPTGLPPGVAPVGAPAPADPLAGMLPTTDPLAGMLPGAAPGMPAGQAPMPMAPVAAPVPAAAPYASQPLVPGQPMPGHMPAQPVPAQPQAGHPAYPPGAAYPQQAPQAASVPVQAPKPVAPKGPSVKVKKNKRRKKSNTSKVILVTSACLLAATIGGLGVFAMFGPGLAVNEDGEVSVRDLEKEKELKRQQQEQKENERPANRRRRKPVDPVMGEMAGGVEPPPMTSTGIPVNQFSPPSTSDGNRRDKKKRRDESRDMTPDPNMTAEMLPDVNPDSTLSVSPGTTTGEMEMSEADVEATNKKIARVRELIAGADWMKMKPEADKITELTLTDEQRTEVDALYNLADLATHYRGAIQRGLSKLEATQDFEVDKGFRVLIVEASSSSLTIRYNARNKSYSSINEIPFRLADKLATFALDMNKSDSQAAKWAYHAVAPLGNPDERSEAINQFNTLSIQEVDGAEVAKVIKSLF